MEALSDAIPTGFFFLSLLDEEDINMREGMEALSMLSQLCFSFILFRAKKTLI